MNEQSVLHFTDPWTAFNHCYSLAQQKLATRNKNAVILATASANNQPSCRVVLLKDYSVQQGFVFHTNYHSHKGQTLQQNPLAALLFYWDDLGMQIRIEGKVRQLPARMSDEYFQTRPRASQISACVSKQSTTLESYEALQAECAAFEQTSQGQPIQRPKHWGGYALTPSRFEFWKDKQSRRHERLIFEQCKTGTVPSNETNQWQKSYLSP